MRALVQRVSSARVTVEGRTVGEIGPGLLIFLGVGYGDSEREADLLATKITKLRVFSDAAGKMNFNVREAGNAALVVSQFTLYADTTRGNRPSYADAAPPGAGRDALRPFRRSTCKIRALCSYRRLWSRYAGELGQRRSGDGMARAASC